jgi:Tfp pilus assembly protein PilV
MLKQRVRRTFRFQEGDTLIEVTIALAIVGAVLISALAVATTAFRLGQTARERTQLAHAAQAQVEALRSFRDNRTWDQFRNGVPGNYIGIEQAMTGGCSTTYTWAARCFSMVKQNVGGTTQWVPQAGGITSNVPNSIIEVSSRTPASQRACAYDFELHYQFNPLGGGQPNRNRITTRLVNLKYAVPAALSVCP